MPTFVSINQVRLCTEPYGLCGGLTKKMNVSPPQIVIVSVCLVLANGKVFIKNSFCLY